MDQVFLSDIELYYTSPENHVGNDLVILGEEVKHISQVMRHKIGDDIYVTDGLGSIYNCSILLLEKRSILARIKSEMKYRNELEKFIICIPRLKNSDRFDAAIEKCVELGFTKFVVFESSRCIAKGDKSERWSKIGLAAMKQSLRSFLPTFQFLGKFNLFNQLDGQKIIFDQAGEKLLLEYLDDSSKDQSKPASENIYLIFGPEGGLDRTEIESIERGLELKISPNRLRSETAVIAAASVIALRQNK